jgi:hypothetical protein
MMPQITLMLLAKGKPLPHDGFMDEHNDVDLGARLLPGVDLALWLRLVALVLLAAAGVGIAFAAH